MLTGVITALDPVSPEVIPSGNRALADSTNSTGSDQMGDLTKPFAASLLHGSARSGAVLLGAGEVATRLGVCKDTVYELCKRGELKHVRILNAIRVHPEDLAAFIERRRRGAPGS